MLKRYEQVIKLLFLIEEKQEDGEKCKQFKQNIQRSLLLSFLRVWVFAVCHTKMTPVNLFKVNNKK